MKSYKKIKEILREIPVPLPRPDLNTLIEEGILQCSKMGKILPLYEETTLTSEEKMSVERHLKVCSHCRSELDSLREINSLLKELPVPEVSPNLSVRIEDALRQERGTRIIIPWERFIPSLPRREQYLGGFRWAVLTASAAALAFLLVYPRLQQKKLPTKEIIQPSAPSVLTVPEVPKKVAVKPTLPKEEVVKKIVPPAEVPAPKVELPKPTVLRLVAEFKPEKLDVQPTILKRGGSFTTLSFLPQEEQIYSSLYNGNSLWLGLFTSPAKLVRVSAEGNYTVYTCAPGDDNATSMVFAQGSLWVGLDSMPLKILKINPEDGSYKSYLLSEPGTTEGTGGIRNAACFDGKYLWFGLWTKPAKLVRVDPEDLSYKIFAAKEGEDNPSFALFDGKNVWFGLYTSPGKILKVNPADGTYLAYNLKEGENNIKTGTFDGVNLWFGLETTPGKLVRVNPEDGTSFAYNLREGENIVTAVTYGLNYLWFTLASEPAKVLQVNPQTGNYIAYSRPDIKSFSSASFDGKNLWFGTHQAKLLKVSL